MLDDLTLFAVGVPGAPDGSLIPVNDVIQGHVGNCYFHAALASLAEHHPAVIQNAISENTATPQPYDFIVQFYEFSGEPYTVDVVLELERGLDAIQLSGDYDANGVEIWTLVREQAFAQVQGGYDNIDTGGHSDRVWPLLTGWPASNDDLLGPLAQDTDAEILQKILDADNAGQGVMVSTVSNPPHPQLVGNHAYSFSDVVTDPAGNITHLRFYNPHGYFTDVPIDQLNENFDTLYIGEAP